MNERSVVFAVRNHMNTGDRKGRTGGPGVKEVEKSPHLPGIGAPMSV